MKQYTAMAVGIIASIAVMVLVASSLPALAQTRGATPGSSGTAVPGRGSMMGNGSGMMGNGGGNMMGGGPGGMMGGRSGQSQSNASGTRLTGDQVRNAVTGYLTTYYSGRNLAIDEIMEFQNNFYARVKEQSTGTGAFELLIDPYSGSVWPEYGPNMMWNTKYGHMANGTDGNAGNTAGCNGGGGMMGGNGNGMMGGSGNGMMGGLGLVTQPTVDMPVSAAQAVQDAQRYLDAQGTGLTVERNSDVFYGYYTLETLKNGNTEGMLSVNGYTGQVWYHTWHGTFIGTVGQ